MISDEVLKDRHISTFQIAQWFTYNHLKDHLGAQVSKACTELAEQMIAQLGDHPELTTGLRKLLEAKDCFVRAAIITPK